MRFYPGELCCVFLLTVSSLFLVLFCTSFYLNRASMFQNVNTNKMAEIFDLKVNYTITNSCTKDSSIKVIQLVTSSTNNVLVRNAFRATYPQYELSRLGIYRVFLLGEAAANSTTTQADIAMENSKYGDILQGNFSDTYRNLTYKNVMGIRWAVTECSAPFIVKMDDDVIVDWYSFMDLLESKQKTGFDMMCLVKKNDIAKRGKNSKWHVTREEYSEDKYPTYCLGWIYTLTRRSGEKLLNAMRGERFFWIDDVLFTGILAKKLNLKLENFWEYLVKRNRTLLDECVGKRAKCSFVAFLGERKNLETHGYFKLHSKWCHETPSCTQEAVENA